MRTAWHNTDVVPSVPRRMVIVAGWALRKGEERLVDARYRRSGLETAGPDFDQFDGTSTRRGYVATDWRVLRKVFDQVPIGPDDVLLEYGAGRGRVVVWAMSRFPLRRIVGVERDPDLAAAAQANLDRWRGPRRCRDVSIVCADAQEFPVPDDVTLVYLFNPFMGEVFDQVVTRIGESLARRPRTVRVIYFYPIMHDSLIDAGFTLERHHRHVLYAWATYGIGGAATTP